MEKVDGCHEERREIGFDQDALGEAQIFVLAVTGMGCINCANRVFNGLIATPGVLWAEVDQHTGRAFVSYMGNETGINELTSAVKKAGTDNNHQYSARLLEVVEAGLLIQ